MVRVLISYSVQMMARLYSLVRSKLGRCRRLFKNSVYQPRKYLPDMTLFSQAVVPECMAIVAKKGEENWSASLNLEETRD